MDFDADLDPPQVMLKIGDDYNKWRGEIYHVVQKTCNAQYTHLERYLTDAERGEEGFREKTAQAAIIILAHVSADIISRIPSEDLLDAPRLLTVLKSRSKTFNFDNLPPEIQSRVYAFVPGFPANKQDITVATIFGYESTLWKPYNPTARHGSRLELLEEDHDHDQPFDEEINRSIAILKETARLKTHARAVRGRFNIMMHPVTQVCKLLRERATREIFKNRTFVFDFSTMYSAAFARFTLVTWFRDVVQGYSGDISGFCLTFGYNPCHRIELGIGELDGKVYLIDDPRSYVALMPTPGFTANHPPGPVHPAQTGIEALLNVWKEQVVVENKQSDSGADGDVLRRILLGGRDHV
jgi:hypothetical protein